MFYQGGGGGHAMPIGPGTLKNIPVPHPSGGSMPFPLLIAPKLLRIVILEVSA